MDHSDHPNLMVSSAYSDLTEHRREALNALHRLGFFDTGMEYDAADPKTAKQSRMKPTSAP